ncbi:MAG: sugar transferase [Clostridia bacterium]|nr:sugar transferase [Clostridia bacterium]
MYAKFFKRFIDFSLSLIALIVLSPILLMLIIIGAIAMKGNPFFTQLRPGKIDPKTGKEKIFRLIKFRTMSNKRNDEGALLPEAVRLNKYGRILRSTSLDELPELLNILIGDMSIVGPRPLLVRYLSEYNEEQRHRHDVRPGLTGLAQVNGRNALDWEEKFKLDVAYIRNITFLGDVMIIWKTVMSVLKHEGITFETEAVMKGFKRKDTSQYQ